MNICYGRVLGVLSIHSVYLQNKVSPIQRASAPTFSSHFANSRHKMSSTLGVQSAKLCVHCPPMKRRWSKLFSKCLLALILGICSIWQVWEQITKFLEGGTTTSLEKVHNKYLPLPQIVLCSSKRYKYDVLTDMGLPKNFLDDHRKKHISGKFPDLNDTWLKATWSREDFDFDWKKGK